MTGDTKTMPKLIRRGAVVIAVAALMMAAPLPAAANWLTHILREAGEAGGKGALHAPSHLGPIGKAAVHLKGLQGAPKGALAAHATPEGHWQFINRDGHVFTAGTPDEMRRVLPTLAPDAAAAGETKLSLYLSEDSIFRNRAALDNLPRDAEMHAVTSYGTFPVARTGAGGLSVRIKPNLVIDVAEQSLFDETMFALGRQLNKSNIRTLAFEPGAPKTLSAAPKLDPQTKAPLVDQIDPEGIATAFSAIRGQTALVTARVEDGKLSIRPASGPEISRDIGPLLDAAKAHDVNLIILQSDAGRQAGGRNWLWQRIEVGGLKDASGAANLGDFLDALASRRGGFRVEAALDGPGRVHISAVPDGNAGSLVGDATSTLGELVGHVTGEVITKSAEIYSRDQSQQREIDGRLIPGIPTSIQIPYLASVVFGILAWATSRSWWRRIWPSKPRAEGEGRVARMLRAIPRELVYLLIFLPVVGFPAFLWHVLVSTWNTILAPFRWFRRRFLLREV